MAAVYHVPNSTCPSPLHSSLRASYRYRRVSLARSNGTQCGYLSDTYPPPFTSEFGRCHRTGALHQVFAIPAPGDSAGRRERNLGPVWSASASKEPFNVIITGSSKGLGLALAEEFLRAGDRVLICSRSEERVREAVDDLRTEFGENKVVINNAGSNAYSYGPLVDSDNSNLEEIVGTNTLGVMLCCRQAILLMREQEGAGGHIFNMDGAGADGNATPRFAAYGATKRCLAQFTKSLQPGMVTTELLMAGATTRQAKFFINALAEPAEQVAQYLVPRIRDVLISRGNSSTYIRFLTGPKAYVQILSRLLFKARKDKFVSEDV